jgi:hypothetical protein
MLVEPPAEPVTEPAPIPVNIAPDSPRASHPSPSPVSPKARQRRFDLMLDAALRDEVREAARLADQEGRAGGGDGMELSGAMIVRAALRVTLRDARLAPKVRREAVEEWKAITAEARKTGRGE